MGRTSSRGTSGKGAEDLFPMTHYMECVAVVVRAEKAT